MASVDEGGRRLGGPKEGSGWSAWTDGVWELGDVDEHEHHDRDHDYEPQ